MGGCQLNVDCALGGGGVAPSRRFRSPQMWDVLTIGLLGGSNFGRVELNWGIMFMGKNFDRALKTGIKKLHPDFLRKAVKVAVVSFAKKVS